VVWQDNRNQATRKSDICGQRLSATGSRLLGNFRVCDANSAALDQDPAVAVNALANEYPVVWTDWRTVTTRGGDTYGQRITGWAQPARPGHGEGRTVGRWAGRVACLQGSDRG
jgi:hypothetical protein